MRWIGWVLIILGLGLVLLWERSAIVQMGLEIETLQAERQALLQAHHELRVEIASLASYRRIEEIATTKLGMVRPASHQVVVVMDGPSGPPDRQWSPSIRLAGDPSGLAFLKP